jgi:hypothetical protein
MPDSVQDLIRQEAAKQGVPPELALAVADQESSFNPTVTNPTSGALGTFQILPATGKMLGVDPTDPRQNISGGVQYLRQLLDQHQGNLQKVLETYGGVRTDQTYVPSVLRKIPQYKAAQAAPVGPVGASPPAPYTGTNLDQPSNSVLTASGRSNIAQRVTALTTKGVDTGRSILRGLDPRTAAGRQNLAGAAGSAALTALAPELEIPALVGRAYQIGVPLAGAYAGGATAQAGEDLIGGRPPNPSAMAAAGQAQLGTEAAGQGISRLVGQPIARRLGASGIAARISTALDDALETLQTSVKAHRPSVTPSAAGRAVQDVAYGQGGAAKLVKDQLGEDVSTAATSGPPIPTAPLQQRLDELRAQITPSAAHTPSQATIDAAALPSAVPSTKLAAPDVAARQKQLLGLQAAALPPDHPLPATLDAVEEALQGQSSIPFEDAHKLKRALDDAVNWDSPAKKQAQQLTKGFRQTLRDQLSSHPPYNAATARYGAVAKLYNADAIKAIRNAAATDPGVLVRKLSPKNPEGVKLVRDLVRDVPALPEGTAAGASQGTAAWQGVQDAWTHEHLFAKGPDALIKRVSEIEASGQGPAFLDALYGDAHGQQLWSNTKQLADGLAQAKARVDAFSQSDLAHATPLTGAVRDAALALMPTGLHSVHKISATSRFLWGTGTGVSEMLEHAAHSDRLTQFLVKHVLTGPNPGQGIADFMRWYTETEGAPDQAVASHAPTTAALSPAIGTPPPR